MSLLFQSQTMARILQVLILYYHIQYRSTQTSLFTQIPSQPLYKLTPILIKTVSF